jgi:dolichyl-phosphate beta-glucosyltransferase
LVTIILPCYNEALRLDTKQILDFLEHEQNGISLLFVDDGSTDGTLETISDLQNRNREKITILSLAENQGKAEAVRQGVLNALTEEIDFIGYWDADLATPLSLIPELREAFVHDTRRKMICGSRVLRLGASIQRHWFRHYPGRIIATCISMVLGMPFYDTQCGAKLMKKDLAQEIFREPFLSPWLFDVELIARIIRKVGRAEASKMIYELPLQEWRDVSASKIRALYLPKIPLELLHIYFHYNLYSRQQQGNDSKS